MWDAKVEEGAQAGAGVVAACIAVVALVVRVIAVLTRPENASICRQGLVQMPDFAFEGRLKFGYSLLIKYCPDLKEQFRAPCDI